VPVPGVPNTVSWTISWKFKNAVHGAWKVTPCAIAWESPFGVLRMWRWRVTGASSAKAGLVVSSKAVTAKQADNSFRMLPPLAEG
jgi:hypothetical protein